MNTAYNNDFFEYVDQQAANSAAVIIPLIQKYFTVSSVLDIGCGRGMWLKTWKENGAKDIAGIDGNYIEADKLHIPAKSFKAYDLSKPFNLNLKFDLVQSLEVAEHLPKANADRFVKTLIDHSDVIIFSAAVPFQVGDNHINEQPHEYWQEKFYSRGYFCIDFLRPQLKENKLVADFYRNNIFLFVKLDKKYQIKSELLQYEIKPGEKIKNYWNWLLIKYFYSRYLPEIFKKPVRFIKNCLKR